jgi:hypothetical protein
VTLPAGAAIPHNIENRIGPRRVPPQNIGRQHRSPREPQWVTHNWGGYHAQTTIHGRPGDSPGQLAYRFAGASRRVFSDMLRDLRVNMT